MQKLVMIARNDRI